MLHHKWQKAANANHRLAASIGHTSIPHRSKDLDHPFHTNRARKKREIDFPVVDPELA
jgi:hypothetical protein